MGLLKIIAQFEIKKLRRDAAKICALAVYFGLIFLASYNGKKHFNEVQSEQVSLKQESEESFMNLIKATQNNEENLDLRPNSVGSKSAARYIFKSSSPYAMLSIGQSKIFPSEYAIGTREDDFTVISDHAHLDNPQITYLGNFDFAFVIIWLLPILIIVFSYNILSSEEENGTIKLLSAQPISTFKYLFTKVLVNFLIISFFLIISCAVAFLIFAPEVFTNLISLTTLTVHLLLYTLFWLLICLLVNLFRKASLNNLSTLFLVWLAFVLFIPTGIAMYAANQNPVPSRMQLLNNVRTATQEIDNDASRLLDAYYFDHPELAPKGENRSMASYVYKGALKRNLVYEAAQPVVLDYYNQLEAQANVAKIFKFVSPAMLMQSCLDNLSSNTLEDFNDFNKTTDSARLKWRKIFEPKIFKDENMTLSELKKLPTFSSKKPIVNGSLGSLLPLTLFNILLFILLFVKGFKAK